MKKRKSIKDKLISISLSPNSTGEDIKTAFLTLFQPWKWRNGENVAKFEKEFQEYLGVKHVVSFESGRGSFYALLKCMDIEEGDEVIIQGYTCVVVVNSVIWAKAKPIYVDINENDLNLNIEDLKNKITEKTKIIVTQNSFGQPSELKRILEIAREKNIKIIEDCAHSLGAEYFGKKVGTFGDAAFFSFGRDKIISSINGGMAVTNDEKLYKKLVEFKSDLKFQPLRKIFQHLMHPLIFGLAVPLYNTLNIGKLIILASQKLHIISKVIQPKEKIGVKPKDIPSKFPNALAKIALKQFKNLNFFNAHRIKISNLYSERLAQLGINTPPKIDGRKNVFLRYNIMVDSADALRKYAKQKNILLGDWYDTIIAPKYIDSSKFFYSPGQCPNAEKISTKIVNLPTHHKIKEDDAERICEVIQQFFNITK